LSDRRNEAVSARGCYLRSDMPAARWWILVTRVVRRLAARTDRGLDSLRRCRPVVDRTKATPSGYWCRSTIAFKIDAMKASARAGEHVEAIGLKDRVSVPLVASR